MASLALLHRRRVLAEKSAEQSTHGEVVTSSEYELMLMQLASDRQRLKQIQSIEKKIETKRAMIGAYQDWINASLQAGQGAQDLVLVTMLVWHIDIGEYGRALAIAEYVIKHDLTFPDHYKRNVATLLLDEIPDAYIKSKQFDAGAEAVLKHVHQLTQDKDAPDQARAKLHKALALAMIAQLGEDDLSKEQIEPAQAALQQLERALSLFNGIGVKKDIERLERSLKKATSS